MKQFIKDRIKELDTQINSKREEVERLNDMPDIIKLQPDELRRKRLINDSINSLVSIRQKNDDILKGRISDV